ncbi:MAG: flagellar hook-length control protein FliK, partial [Candidatus Desantisbacteria bacterium]
DGSQKENHEKELNPSPKGKEFDPNPNISLHTHRSEEPLPQSTILSETKTSTTLPTFHPLSKAIYQIVENAEIHRQKEDVEMEIFLKPEFLGKLNMKLNLTSDGILDVKFTVGTKHLKELMEQNLQNLRSTFNSLEVAVGEIGVSVDNGSNNQGNPWNKTYNENTHDQARYSFEPKIPETPSDDRATSLYWRQASFEFTA